MSVSSKIIKRTFDAGHGMEPPPDYVVYINDSFVCTVRTEQDAQRVVETKVYQWEEQKHRDIGKLVCNLMREFKIEIKSISPEDRPSEEEATELAPYDEWLDDFYKWLKRKEINE